MLDEGLSHMIYTFVDPFNIHGEGNPSTKGIP
jgi:hypothetical protein